MKNEIRVGLTVLAGIVLLYLMIAWARRIHFFAPEENQYLIHFEQVSGLLEGDPVHVRGYLAGRVMDIHPEKDFMAVMVSVDERIELYADAYAEIRVKELLGGKMIEIFPGNGAVAFDNQLFLPGKTSPDFASAFSGFGDITGSIDIAGINKMIGRMDSLTANIQLWMTESDPQRVVAMVEDISGMVARVNRLISDVNDRKIIYGLDSTLTTVNHLLKKTEPLFDEAEKITRSAEFSLIPRADSLVGQLESTLRSLDKTITSVNAVMDKLEEKDNVGGRIFNDPGLSAQLDTTLYNLNKVLEQIHSKRVIVGMKRKKGE
ncbi:MAG: MlaD family protein [Bacteroidia bacterium]